MVPTEFGEASLPEGGSSPSGKTVCSNIRTPRRGRPREGRINFMTDDIFKYTDSEGCTNMESNERNTISLSSGWWT